MISFKPTEVVKCLVPYDFKERLEAKAHRAGCNLSEYMRDVLYLDVDGETFGEHVADHRRSVIGRKDPDQAQVSTRFMDRKTGAR